MTSRSGIALVLMAVATVNPVFSQTKNDSVDHSAAYYDFAMAHLYGELAGAYGNRGEYVNKAIDSYRQAMKQDPSASYIEEELTEFYVQTGQLEKATQQAESMLKANPANNNARKILARIYSRQIGDPDQGKVDQAMLQNALAQYQKIVEQDPKDSESLSMLARLYRASRNDGGAEKAYKQVLALDPNDADALNGLALVYADRGDLTNAILWLKQAVEHNPDPRTVVMLAEFYDQNREFSKGADTWQQAIALTNDNVRVRRAWAADLMISGRVDEALKAFQELVADDPGNEQLQLQIAEILSRKHDYAGAGAAIEKARAIKPGSPDVQYAQADLLRQQGKIPEAISVLQKLLAETRKDQYSEAERGARMRILDRVGAMQQDSGKVSEAVASFRQITELDSSLAPKVEAQVIEAYKSGKDYKAARQAADSALRKFSGDRSLIFVHAGLLGELGQTDQALSELKALPNSAKDREVIIQMAQVQDHGKRFEDERKSLDAADALTANPAEKLVINMMRGAMYEREKNFDAAEKIFRGVLMTDPENAGAMNYLGYMFADRGIKLDEAQDLVAKALDLDPGNGAYLDSLGWVHYHQNRLDQAVEELRQAVDKVGKDPTVHDHLGDVYFKQGKIREAIQQWEASIAEYKTAAPSDQDPAEMAKVTKKLENAKVRVAEKAR